MTVEEKYYVERSIAGAKLRHPKPSYSFALPSPRVHFPLKQS